MASTLNTVVDYVVFAVFIVASCSVAIYSRFSGPKQNTKAQYVFATGSVSMAAMMLSIARGTLGVRSFLGYPSELYYRGSAMWETLYGMICAYPIVCFVFVPVYYSLGITSVYQYLDLRFKSRLVRCLASLTYVIRSLLNLGVTVFTPCVALNTVIGLPYWASIFGICFISIIFTIMGGLKAAILADVLQGLTMIFCSCAIIVQGALNTGLSDVYTVPRDGGRLKFMNFDPDPTVRVTTMSALFGQLFMSLSIFGCQQNFVQRYCSMKSQKTVTQTLMANIPVITILFSLSWVAGMVIYANYADCDPLSLGYIKKIDEIVPFFVEDQFTYLPGFLGLFMATLFNGALSLAVSNLNSLATVTWEDFVSQIPRCSHFTDRQQLLTIKIIGAVYGVVIAGISVGVGMLSGVIESSMLMTSATSGPLLGVFLLAILAPCVNWKGASAGMIAGHAITLWITFGSLTVDKRPVQMLPLSVEGCTNVSYNHISALASPLLYAEAPLEWGNHSLREEPLYSYNLSRVAAPPSPASYTPPSDPLSKLYSMTYMYYSLVGCGITLVVGVLVSYIAGTSPEDAYDEKLIHPLALRVTRWLPGKPRRFVSDRITSPEKHRQSSGSSAGEEEAGCTSCPCVFPAEGRYRGLDEPYSVCKSPV
ncbi:sodium-coupled monocarboxylate transporter 1 [Bacillus rossius redtenbacheri]|uniref:sodium-coupled monocarboxylate transporter 1 n=1 Tax=Bacillus rossius redtenbacheri TaxID=93214 RepID=UPI002FDE35FF